ncbi:MAG: hypothetical protein IKE65_09815, partial [Clostridia bacterium]|nr:hypothetical protein [Clostridia bacterium]
ESYEEEPAPIVYSNGTVFSTALSYELEFYGIDPLPADAAKVDNYLRTRVFAHQADFGEDDVDPAAAEANGINWWKYYLYTTFDDFYKAYAFVYDDVIPS